MKRLLNPGLLIGACVGALVVGATSIITPARLTVLLLFVGVAIMVGVLARWLARGR